MKNEILVRARDNINILQIAENSQTLINSLKITCTVANSVGTAFTQHLLQYSQDLIALNQASSDNIKSLLPLGIQATQQIK